jgi:hypothetical protein
MVARPWTGPIVAPTLADVLSMHDALTGPSGAVCFLAALRLLWLLPDWLAKWQSLVAYRRRLRRRDQAVRRRRDLPVSTGLEPEGE